MERACDRVAILNYGRLVAESPIEELLERYAQPIFELEPDANQSRATEDMFLLLVAGPGSVPSGVSLTQPTTFAA